MNKYHVMYIVPCKSSGRTSQWLFFKDEEKENIQKAKQSAIDRGDLVREESVSVDGGEEMSTMYLFRSLMMKFIDQVMKANK